MSSIENSIKTEDVSETTLQYIRATGHFCLVSTLAIFVILGILQGSPYDQVWQLVLAHFVSGRAGNIGLGLMKGFNLYFLLYEACMIDFILMFLIYPVFVSGFQQLSKLMFIGRAMKQTHELALKHKHRIEPYGAIGLMVFVIFPFWSTGPLVGVMVGYLLGMSTRITFTTVIIGDVIAVSAWIWAHDMLYEYDKTLALIILIGIFAVAITGTLATRFLRARQGGKEN